MQRPQEYSSLLKRVSLFSGLEPSTIKSLARDLQPRKYAKHAMVFAQNSESEGLYVIRKGRVKVVLHNEAGRETILANFRQGDFFGEMNLFDGEPRSAAVYVTERAELLMLPRQDLMMHLQQKPSIALNILAEMSYRLRRSSEIIGALTLQDAYGRLNNTLLHLAQEDGKPVAEGIRIQPRPTQQDLASMTGTTRETVSRVLSDWQRQDLVHLQRGAIMLNNRFFDDNPRNPLVANTPA